MKTGSAENNQIEIGDVLNYTDKNLTKKMSGRVIGITEQKVKLLLSDGTTKQVYKFMCDY